MPGSFSGGAGPTVALRKNDGGFFIKLYDVPATTRNWNTIIAILRISKSRTGDAGIVEISPLRPKPPAQSMSAADYVSPNCRAI